MWGYIVAGSLGMGPECPGELLQLSWSSSPKERCSVLAGNSGMQNKDDNQNIRNSKKPPASPEVNQNIWRQEFKSSQQASRRN